jgi:ketosteroid isomerase-like protein
MLVRRRTAIALVLPVLALAGGCARPRAASPAPTDLPAQLMAADRAFAEATAARGLDGWMSFIAPDAVRMARITNPVKGEAAIRKSDAAIFANPDVRLTWEPVDAGAFDADVGWTIGTSQVHRRAADGSDSIVGTGHYVTIWRRAADGRWLVVLDTGVQDPRPGS